MRLLKRFSLILLLFLIAAYAGICWMLSNRILSPNSSLERSKSRMQTSWGTSFEAMSEGLPEPIDVSVSSFDGVELKGKYFQRFDSAGCVMIVMHGWSGTWAGALKFAPVLSDCACDLVIYDHRAHGASGGEYPTGSIKESKDLLAMTDYIQQTYGFTDRQVAWVGESWGAATALMAGADEKNVAFIIADSPYQDWYTAVFERGIRDYGSAIDWLAPGVISVVEWRADVDFDQASPVLAASKIEEPVLLIHSQADSSTASWQSVNISKHLNAASQFHHLDWGGDHVEDVRIHKERYRELVNAFIGKVNPDFLVGSKDEKTQNVEQIVGL